MKLFYNNDICPKCGKLTDHRNGKTCSTCYKAWKKNYHAEHREEAKAYQKDYRKTHREEAKAYQKDYQKTQLNSNGIRLNSVRSRSREYLYNVLNQPKLANYEIHHCFGYDDHTKFIYIPKSLHLKIHQYLRDNNIDAKTEHFKDIENLINECKEYKYIIKT